VVQYAIPSVPARKKLISDAQQAVHPIGMKLGGYTIHLPPSR
jgi:hypothetical protein